MHPVEKRRRRRHTLAFKAATVAACRESGASVAAVALERRLNANLLRKWVKPARDGSATKNLIARSDLPSVPTAFMPLKLERTRDPPTAAQRAIRVHIRKGRSRITIEWPATAAGACASCLRELLG